jgi:molybdenum cofactor cytidylyltransferase
VIPKQALRMTLQPLIIAAGASSRMGQDKAELIIDGLMNFTRIVNSCSLAGLQKAPVVVRGCYTELPGHSEDVRLVINTKWSLGRTGSIQAGLRAAPGSFYLLWPVDIPLVRLSTIEALVEICERQSRSKELWIPSYNQRRGHPIIFNEEFARRILQLSPDVSLRSLFPDSLLQHVAVDDASILRDINSAEDLHAIRRNQQVNNEGD